MHETCRSFVNYNNSVHFVGLISNNYITVHRVKNAKVIKLTLIVLQVSKYSWHLYADTTAQ